METPYRNKYIGTVRWFDGQIQNFGFISSAELGDVFFHKESISGKQSIAIIKDDAVVSFKVEESKKICWETKSHQRQSH